ncbi:MAG: DUF177 domain-containing protein [Muribaculaceae bacterium]|nr:DUF177 domain-containing protein [Muribaculaceae bacterium]
MGKFSAYKLPLKSLGVGAHNFEYHLDKQFFVDMESADVHDADLTVTLGVLYNGDFYNLDFHISGDVVLICDRCLDDLRYPIEADYHIVVKYGDDYNDDSDEVLEIPESDSTLNVAYMIYDTATLAIPMKHVHPLGKCNRQMSAMLKKHRAQAADDDAELENALIDEIDNIDADSDNSATNDPRWDALRKLSGDNNITSE